MNNNGIVILEGTARTCTVTHSVSLSFSIDSENRTDLLLRVISQAPRARTRHISVLSLFVMPLGLSDLAARARGAHAAPAS